MTRQEVVLREGPDTVGGRKGYMVEWAGRNAPIVFVFGRAEEPGRAFEHAELFEHIARHHAPAFSRVFLFDSERSGFFRGVTGLGRTIDAVSASLRSMIVGLEPSEIITFGEGLGGLAALIFGVLLGARRVVAVEPVAHLIRDELVRYHDRRWEEALSEFPKPTLAKEYQIATLIARNGFDGRIHALYGTRPGNNQADTVHLNVIHAYWLSQAEGVTLFPFPDLPQGMLGELARRGTAANVLLPHLFDDQVAADSPSELTRPDPVALGLKRKLSYRCEIAWYFEENRQDEEDEVVTFTAAGNPTGAISRKMDDSWRRWLAENLMMEGSHESMVRVLAGKGYSEEESYQEIRRILRSPYFQGSWRLRNRLKKRDWLLTMYRKVRRTPPRIGGDRTPRTPDPHRSRPGLRRQEPTCYYRWHDE